MNNNIFNVIIGFIFKVMLIEVTIKTNWKYSPAHGATHLHMHLHCITLGAFFKYSA